MTRPFLASLTSLFLLMACAHTTTFDSYPEGAKVYINGAEIGTTPVEFEETTGREYYIVRLEKEGFEPYETTLKQEEWSTEAIAGAAALGVGGGCGGCVVGTIFGGVLGATIWGASAASFAGAGYLGYYHSKRLKDDYLFELDKKNESSEPSAE